MRRALDSRIADAMDDGRGGRSTLPAAALSLLRLLPHAVRRDSNPGREASPAATRILALSERGVILTRTAPPASARNRGRPWPGWALRGLGGEGWGRGRCGSW